PGRLVDIGVKRDDGGLANASYPTYQDLRTRATTLNGVYAHPMFPHAMGLSTGDAAAAERVFAHFVTPNYFAVLGATPSAGRLMGAMDSPPSRLSGEPASAGSRRSSPPDTRRAESDDQPGASPVAVLSDGFWTRRFNRD